MVRGMAEYIDKQTKIDEKKLNEGNVFNHKAIVIHLCMVELFRSNKYGHPRGQLLDAEAIAGQHTVIIV